MVATTRLKCFATEAGLLIAVVDHEAPERELGGAGAGVSRVESLSMTKPMRSLSVWMDRNQASRGSTLSYGDCIAGYVVLLLGGDPQVSYGANRRRGDFSQRNLSLGAGGG